MKNGSLYSMRQPITPTERRARLEPHAAMRRLDVVARTLVSYESESIWDMDTATLPAALAAYRTRIRDFAAKYVRPHSRTLDHEKDPALLSEIFSAAAVENIFADLLPPPFGNGRFAVAVHPMPLFYSLKAEELCAACGGIGLALLAHGLGTAPIVLSGDVAAASRFLPEILRKPATGEFPAIVAYAITEPAAGSDVEESHGASLYHPGTIARRVTGGWLLNGRKVFISGGDIASYISVFAALENEGMESWTLFLVRRGFAGFSVARNEKKMGQRASSASELVFENVYVPDDHVIGGLRNGWAINRAVLNYSRVPVAAIALGIARGALEIAESFVARQKLGQKRLIDYQEVQLVISQMMIQVSAMRAMVWQSANSWTVRQYRASAAKVFCSDTAVAVCRQAMEILGNHGFMASTGVEKTWRDARLTQIYEGTNQINRLAAIEDQWHEFDRLTNNSQEDAK